MSTNARLGFDIVATDKTAAAFGSVQRFMSQTQAFQKEMAKFSQPMMQAAANSNRFASTIQNLSFQVQDFAVQVASGTSVTRAFGQQAPQLLSGFGVLGAVLGTVVAIAVPLAGHFLASADAMGALGGAIQTVGPYAAVATAALAGFYAPTVLAGLSSTTSAIGVGLVGAIRSVTAAMMANPLGVLVAGVATAAVAVFAFRDDIKRVFGVDVAGIIKDSTNWVIDKFVKLGQTIGVAWGHIGDIVGNSIVGAANIALQAMTAMVNGGIAGINKLIDAVNSLSNYTGITLGKFAELQAAQFENPFAKGAAQAGSEIGKIWAENQVKDYVGTMASLAGKAMSQVAQMFSGFGGAGGAGGKTKGTAAKNTVDDIYGVGMLDKTFNQLWAKMSEGMPKVDAMTQAFQKMASTVSDSLTTALQGLISGTMSVKDAFAGMAKSIAQQFSQLAAQIIQSQILKLIEMLTDSFLGGGGIRLGGMYFGGAAGLRAGGGPVSYGSSYIVGEKGPELFTPGTSGYITPNNRLGSASSSQRAEASVTINNYAGVEVTTRKTPDMRVIIDIVKKELTQDVLRGGNGFSGAMESRYSLSRAGR